VVFWEGLYEGQAFFEKVAKLHEDMSKMDDRVFGLALRLVCDIAITKFLF
jgi:hypothetical protein